MAVIKIGQGEIEKIVSGVTRVARAKTLRPVAAPYGQQGLVVQMNPINGLTPKGVFQHEQPFVFQVPPQDGFGEDGSFPHEDYVTLGDGTHSTAGSGPALRTVTYSTLFLDWQPPWSVVQKEGWNPDPQEMVGELRKIKNSGRPFHLLVHQSGRPGKYDVDYVATLRSLHWELRSGEDDAVYVTVGFSEFRAPNIERFLVGAAHHAALPAKLAVKTLRDDRNTLAKMARLYYGDPSKWTLIAAANGLSNMQPNRVLTPKNTSRATITVPVPRATKKPTAASQKRVQ